MAATQRLIFNSALTSNVKFTNLNIDMPSLAMTLQTYVVEGSKRYRVSKNDILIMIPSGESLDGTYSLDRLMEWGNPLFNCLIFLQYNAQNTDPNEKIKIRTIPAGQRHTPVTHDEAAKAVFFQFFMVLTRAKYETSTMTTASTIVPKFLTETLALTKTPLEYANMLVTFDLNNLDPSWVRHIQLRDLDQAARSRLGLGIAGYRALNPFKLLPLKQDFDEEFRRPYDVAKSMCNASHNWDFHPSTRNPNLLSLYGPINKNLNNLSLKCFKREDLELLRTHRHIYEVPTEDLGIMNYKGWDTLYAGPSGSTVFAPATS